MTPDEIEKKYEAALEKMKKDLFEKIDRLIFGDDAEKTKPYEGINTALEAPGFESVDQGQKAKESK